MSAQPRVTDPSAFKRASLRKQVLLSVLTLTLYWLVWSYSTAKQLDQGTDQDLTPILGLIPLVNFVSLWQISKAAEAVTEQSGWVLFVLFLSFPPLSWYWIQLGINQYAPR